MINIGSTLPSSSTNTYKPTGRASSADFPASEQVTASPESLARDRRRNPDRRYKRKKAFLDLRLKRGRRKNQAAVGVLGRGSIDIRA